MKDIETTENIENTENLETIKNPSKEELRDFINFFGKLNSKIDITKVLADSDIKFLVLIENKKDSWIYSNELPDDTIMKFITEFFFNEPRAIDTVMKRLEFVKQMFDSPKQRYGSEDDPEEITEHIKENESVIREETKDLTREEMPESVKFPDPQPDDYLTPKDLEGKYQLAPKTLANWRSQGKGPEFFKLGNKVRYLRKNVEKWVEQSRRKTYQSK